MWKRAGINHTKETSLAVILSQPLFMGEGVARQTSKPSSQMNEPDRPPFRVWVWRFLTAAAALLILWKSLEPYYGLPGSPYTDKIEHFLAYLGLSGLALLSRLPLRESRLLATILGFSAAIEILQGLMNMGRTPSWADLAANLLGILVAWGLWKGFQSLTGLKNPT